MRSLILIALFTLCSSSAFAERLYGMAGCGWGSMLMGPEGGQVSAATTNGTFYNQGFGISFGTANCMEPGKVAAIQTQENFFVNNISQLSKEMAQGKGEYLEAFSQTFGCNSNSMPEFGGQMKKSYNAIFSSPGAVSMLEEVRSQVKNNPTLVKQCTAVI